MTFQVQSALGVLVLVSAMLSPAARGAIAWGTPATASADTDVLNNGTPGYAYQLAGTFSTTLNGVTFQPANTFAAGNLASGATNPNLVMSPGENGFEHFDGGATITGLSSTYTYLLASAGYDNGETSTVTLNNLTSGTTYDVEIWVNDARNVGRSETLDGAGPTLSFDASNTNGGAGQFDIGTFTAGSTGSQSFTITPSNGGVAQLNAIEVQAVPVPEPATTTLLFVGTFIFFSRTRGYKSAAR